MIKNLLNKTIILCLLGEIATLNLEAQSTVVRRAKRKAKTEHTNSQLSNRAINQSLDQQDPQSNKLRWQKTIYRFLDLSKEQNAALLYAGNNEQNQNLFFQTFNLIKDNTLKVYEYLDGVEYYDEAHQLDFKAFLERFEIPFKVAPHRGRPAQAQNFEIAKEDIPYYEVKGYYVKEVWYFNQANSRFDVEIESLCPILFHSGDSGEFTYPLFWIKYSELRPYISTNLMMLDDMNNLAQATLDDFFTLRMYQGDIVKVKNMLNKSLMQQVGADSIQARRKQIDEELEAVSESAFTSSALIKMKAEGEDKKSQDKKKNSRDKRFKSSDKDESSKAKKEITKAQKPKAQASSKASHSVRGRF